MRHQLGYGHLLQDLPRRAQNIFVRHDMNSRACALRHQQAKDRPTNAVPAASAYPISSLTESAEIVAWARDDRHRDGWTDRAIREVGSLEEKGVIMAVIPLKH
jgi:hypothetical protein